MDLKIGKRVGEDATEDIIDERDLYAKSPDVAYHRWSTELEPQLEPDENFGRKHRNLIRPINKFAPLSYITDRRMHTINDLRRLKTILLEKCNLSEAAERESLKIIAFYQESRGDRGFYSRLQVTRHEITEERGGTKARTTGGLFKKKPAVREEEDVI